MANTVIYDPSADIASLTQWSMLKGEAKTGDNAYAGNLVGGDSQATGQLLTSLNVFGKLATAGGARSYESLADSYDHQDIETRSVGRYTTMSAGDSAALLGDGFGIAAVPKPAPLAPITDGPEEKPVSPEEMVDDARTYLSLPQISRKEVTSADGTDALIFQAMFLFIDFQRQEVAAMMDTVKYNNDMARQIEQYKAAVNNAADRVRAEKGDNPTTKIDDAITDYIWSQNLTINGVPVHKMFPDVEAMRNKSWTAAELTQMATALDIKRTEFTDMNSQNMQKLQMAMGLLNVFQQMLTSLIDTWKRVKEGIASKL